MTTATAAARRSIPRIVALLAALGVGLALLVAPNYGNADAAEHSGHGRVAAPTTPRQVVFHDEMRRLWEDHATWTRLAIVTFAQGSPAFDPTAARLLQNQGDIGQAIVPFFGADAGARLTELLREHITVAVEVLQAAKAADSDAFEDARDRWYQNGRDVADFLTAANPRYWPQDVMRPAMELHLDQTLAEAAHELEGDFAASIKDYDEVHEHILDMADVLSSGIMQKFPEAFRR